MTDSFIIHSTLHDEFSNDKKKNTKYHNHKISDQPTEPGEKGIRKQTKKYTYKSKIKLQ